MFSPNAKDNLIVMAQVRIALCFIAIHCKNCEIKSFNLKKIKGLLTVERKT